MKVDSPIVMYDGDFQQLSRLVQSSDTLLKWGVRRVRFAALRCLMDLEATRRLESVERKSGYRDRTQVCEDFRVGFSTSRVDGGLRDKGLRGRLHDGAVVDASAAFESIA